MAGPSLARRALWLVPPFAVGAFLRLTGLSHQVLVGDEIHGLRAIVTLPWNRLWWFHGRDHCIPLSVLGRVLSDLGVGLSETVLRAPSIVAGLLTLVLLPLWAARWAGGDRADRADRIERGDRIERIGALLAWLLALSPSFVYYARIARPYALSVLLAALAAAAFWHWYRGGGHRWAVLYVGAGGLALWLHLGFAPFLGAALIYAAADRLWLHRLDRRDPQGGRPGRSLGALAAVGAGLASTIALIVLPVFRSFLRLLRNKQGEGETAAGVLVDTLRMESGSPHLVVTALFWLIALAGFGVLLRRRPRFALFGLTLVAAQWVGILGIIQPFGIHQSVVLGRYVLVGLPVVLLWMAVGLEAAGEAVAARLRARGGRHRFTGWAAPFAVVALLAAGSSWAADPWLRLGPFAGTNDAVDVTGAPPVMPPDRVPAVYRLIAEAPGEGALIEAVTTTVTTHIDSTVALARVHRRPVVLAIEMPWLDDSRVALRTVLPTDPARLCRSDARFMILHRHWLELESLVDSWSGVQEAPAGPGPRKPGPMTLRLAKGMVEECGEPYLAGEERWLWDLERRRALSP